ncbi:MAG: hypothetical protein ACLFUB_18880 [Cyclobacteriaceae bacterium]
MKTRTDISDLIAVDPCSNHLTLHSQERLRDAFLHQAHNLATHQAPQNEISEKAHELYYYALAQFMDDYPSIFIDLVLIKPRQLPLLKHSLPSLSL